MDALSVGASQRPPATHFEQLSDIRAEKRQHLRGRNNVTSCRSPNREWDAQELKSRLKERRHEEFLRRRSVSPEFTKRSSRRKPPASTMRHRTSSSQTETLHTANGRPKTILTPSSSPADGAPSTSSQDPSRSEQTAVTVPDGAPQRKQGSSSAADMQESNQQRLKGRPKKQRSQKVSIQSETVFQSPSSQSHVGIEKKVLENSSMRTEPGFVLVRESDIERLADFLEEALWREESVKKKLAALQQSATHLITSSDTVWTSRFSEDLLRSQIRALEAQLHVCLQEAVQREKAEALRWQNLYQELKLNSGQFKQSQRFNHQQLQQQLHSQAELSRGREDQLEAEVASLRQEKRELQYSLSLLEEDNQTLREEVQQLTDGGDGGPDFTVLSEKVAPGPSVRREAELEEQLRQSEEQLQLRHRECEELQTELDVLKQECQSSQVRLSQCREELRRLSPRRRTRTPCGSRWSVCAAFCLLLAVAAMAVLFLWHPPFREQAEELYADVWTRIEGYLVEAASSPHSGCFRPI